MDLASKVLQEIQEKQIKPKSKGLFWLEHFTVILGFVVVVLLGAYTLSLFLFTLRVESGEFQRGMGYLSVAAEKLPMLLIFTVIITIVLGFGLFRKTRKGYRTRSIWLLLGLLIAVGVGGFVLDRSGAVFLAHRFLMQSAPAYRGAMEQYREKVWSQPEKGRISGVVEQVDWDHFILKDKQGHLWTVDDVDAHWREVLKREAGIQIKVLGHMNADSSFDATHVLPWRNGLPGKGYRQGTPSIPVP